MALNDALTGLANRASFNDRLDAQIRLANYGGPKFALAAIDLDRFKEINDIKGHSAGDEALKILAQRMRDSSDGTLLSRAQAATSSRLLRLSIIATNCARCSSSCGPRSSTVHA